MRGDHLARLIPCGALRLTCGMRLTTHVHIPKFRASTDSLSHANDRKTQQSGQSDHRDDAVVCCLAEEMSGTRQQVSATSQARETWCELRYPLHASSSQRSFICGEAVGQERTEPQPMTQKRPVVSPSGHARIGRFMCESALCMCDHG